MFFSKEQASLKEARNLRKNEGNIAQEGARNRAPVCDCFCAAVFAVRSDKHSGTGAGAGTGTGVGAGAGTGRRWCRRWRRHSQALAQAQVQALVLAQAQAQLGTRNVLLAVLLERRDHVQGIID